MASLKNLVLALVVIGAAGNVHGEAAEEAAHVAEVATEALEAGHEDATNVALPLEALEVEVVELKAELHQKAAVEGPEACEAAGLVLLGSMAFVMLVFYLVNSREPVVVKQTWNLTSTSISIFAAVMLNTCVKEFVIAVGVHDEDTAFSEFIYLFCWWLSAVVLLYIDRDSPLRLLGYGTIYGHILGFSAIGAYGALAKEYLHESYWSTLGVIFIYIVSVPILVAPTALFARILPKVSSGCRNLDKLHEQCTETGLDFFAMGLSYLICMFFRGWIKSDRIGTAAGLHPNPTGTQAHEVVLLSVVGWGFVLLAMVSHYMQKNSEKSAAAMFHVLATISALTCAWCWLDTGNWVSLSKMAPHAGEHHRRLNGHEVTEPEGVEVKSLGLFHMPQGVFMAQIMVAAFYTLFFAFAVQLFACLTHRIKDLTTLLKGSLTAISLLVGLSWEHIFDTAIEEVAKLADAEKGKQFIKVAISLALVLVVLPAWMVHILPKHNAEMIEKYQGKKLSVFMVCCDGQSDEEGYDEADEEWEYEDEEE